MRCMLIAIAVVVSTTAHADHVWTGRQTRPIVDAEVHQVIRDGATRVVTGTNAQGWWLFVEKLDRGRPVWQHWITEASWGPSTISVARDLRSVQLTGYGRQVVSFNAHYEGRDWLKCTIDTRQRSWRTSCEGKYTGSGGAAPPPPPPAPPEKVNWAGKPEVIKACGDVFDGQANESACLDTVVAYRYNPLPAISTCDRSMDGDENELKCLRWGGSTPFDQSAALMSCDNAMDGDDNELKCFGAVINARYAMSPAIEACDRAMDGDENELRCIGYAVSAAKNPAATIAACDQSMDGDESELACIRRGIPINQ